jgi:hypothetical protein
MGGGFDIGGLMQMLMGGKMGGGGGMGGVVSGSSSTAPAAKPGVMSQIGSSLLDAQKGGWGYGWQNALSGQQGAQPVGQGAKDKELSSLLMLLKILQSGAMTNGLGAAGGGMGGPPVATRGSAAASPWSGIY